MKQPSKNTDGFFPSDQRRKSDEHLEQEPVQRTENKDTFSTNAVPVIIITPT